MGALAGKQFIGTHTSATDVTAELCMYLCRAFPECRISLGVIENFGSKSRKDATWTLKIHEDTGCIRIVCLQKSSKQTIRIYSAPSYSALIASVSAHAQRKRWRLRVMETR